VTAAPFGGIAVRKILLVTTLSLIAIGVRLRCLDFLTDDVAYWVIPWYEFLRDNGISALGREFPNAGGWDSGGNYPPTYFYLLYVATWFDGLLPPLYLIKAISVLFDCVAATAMFGIVRVGTGSSEKAWTSWWAVLCAPTVIANGALWGQCDSIHTSLMLGSVYCALRGWPVAMVTLLGSALAFKAQAVFLLPFVLMLILRSKAPLWSVAILPLAYSALMLPAALMGRPLVELLTIYLDQASLYRSLSMNAPNLYYFVSSEYLETGTVIGIGVTIVGALAFAVLPQRRRVVLSPEFLVLAATVSVAAAPFLLPRMHDRYFFPADLMSIALAFYVPSLWFVAVGFQVSSLLAYVPIISDTLNHGAGEYRALMPAAVAINLCLVGVLAAAYWRALGASRAPNAEVAPSAAVTPRFS
jgi:Gpi18-like mannosyltransferase